MMAAILRTLGLDLIGSLERAYIAKEKAKSDRERLLHAERIKDIEAELESQRTATGFALGQMNHPVWWAAWLLFVLPVGFYTAAIFLVSTVPALEWWEVRRVPQVQEDWARWIVLSIFGAQIVAGGIGRKLRGGS